MIKLNTTDISKIYLGSNEINKIYLGSQEVFTGGGAGPTPTPTDDEITGIGTNTITINTNALFKILDHTSSEGQLIDYYLQSPINITIGSNEPAESYNASITTTSEEQIPVSGATITSVPSQKGLDGTTTRNLPVKYNNKIIYYTSSKATSNSKRQLWYINFNIPDTPKELMVNVMSSMPGGGFNSGKLCEIYQDGTLVTTESYASGNTSNTNKICNFRSKEKVLGDGVIKFYTTELSNSGGQTYRLEVYGSLNYLKEINKNGQPMYISLSGYKFDESRIQLDIQCTPQETQNETTWGTLTITDNILTNATKGGTIDN